MRVTVLAGGYGGARFLVGLRRHLGAADTITAVVNTADDIVLHGLSISPDLDTVMYTLGDGLDTERGWGRTDEAFRVNEELQAYGVPSTWFGLGDRDLATHLIRTQMLGAGYRLTDVTAALATRWQPGVTLLPMTDDRVETHVIVNDGDGRRAIHFQEWWIRHRAQLPAEQFLQVGADTAHATPEALAAVADADVVMLAPSNPVVSIGAMMAWPTSPLRCAPHRPPSSGSPPSSEAGRCGAWPSSASPRSVCPPPPRGSPPTTPAGPRTDSLMAGSSRPRTSPPSLNSPQLESRPTRCRC